MRQTGLRHWSAPRLSAQQTCDIMLQGGSPRLSGSLKQGSHATLRHLGALALEREELCRERIMDRPARPLTGDASVALLDLDAARVFARIRIGPHPQDVVMSHDTMAFALEMGVRRIQAPSWWR